MAEKGMPFIIGAGLGVLGASLIAKRAAPTGYSVTVSHAVWPDAAWVGKPFRIAGQVTRKGEPVSVPVELYLVQGGKVSPLTLTESEDGLYEVIVTFPQEMRGLTGFTVLVEVVIGGVVAARGISPKGTNIN